MKSRTQLILSLALLAFSIVLTPSNASANVTVYQHCNYKGYGVNLRPSGWNLSNFRQKGIRNDDLSSIRVAPGYQITVYQHDNFKGKSKTFRSNDKCLVNDGFNDTISSVLVKRTLVTAKCGQRVSVVGVGATGAIYKLKKRRAIRRAKRTWRRFISGGAPRYRGSAHTSYSLGTAFADLDNAKDVSINCKGGALMRCTVSAIPCKK